MNILLQVEGASMDEMKKYTEIIRALIQCGGLSGMKNGSTNIHFDSQGNFMGIRFNYWPWKKRSQPLDK
jgi:hypothetical protein